MGLGPSPALLPVHAPHRHHLGAVDAVVDLAHATTTTTGALLPQAADHLRRIAASPALAHGPARLLAVSEIASRQGDDRRATSVEGLDTADAPGATLSRPAGRALALSHLVLARALLPARTTLRLHILVAGAAPGRPAEVAEATAATTSGIADPGRPEIESWSFGPCCFCLTSRTFCLHISTRRTSRV